MTTLAAPSAPPARSSRKARYVLLLSLIGGVFLLGTAVGYLLPARNARPPLLSSQPDGATLLKPGPWGELEYIPIRIAAPAERLPVRAMEAVETHWFFKDFTRDQWAKFLESLDLSASQREEMLAASVVHVVPMGLDVTPPRPISLALSPRARQAICALLIPAPQNRPMLCYLHSAILKEHLREAGVTDETTSLVTRATCPYGEYQVLIDLPSVLSAIPNYDEKSRFVKSLTMQDTLLLRLHVTQESNVEALARYWGRACWSTDVKSLFESLARVPKGAWIDVVEALPPLPSSLIYTFPVPDNPLNGPAPRRDCHWTSMNFFREPPDSNFSNPDYVHEKLKTEYYRVTGDPCFGDIVLFSLPDGSIIHSAVFVADDIVYTKNGDTPLHPWMLSRISDLLRQYSCQAPPSQRLTVTCFRNKYY